MLKMDGSIKYIPLINKGEKKTTHIWIVFLFKYCVEVFFGVCVSLLRKSHAAQPWSKPYEEKYYISYAQKIHIFLSQLLLFLFDPR